MNFFKRNIFNLLLAMALLLLLIPQTRMPIQVFAQRLFSFSPSVVPEEKRKVISDYNWQLEELNSGRTEDLKSAKGEVILINLWATWCPPCIAEMPSLQNLYNDYGDRVNFYMVSSEKPVVLRNFIEKHGYDFPVYHALSEIPEVLGSKVLPTTYLISAEGEILISKTGSADWNSSRIRKLLDKLLQE